MITSQRVAIKFFSARRRSALLLVLLLWLLTISSQVGHTDSVHQITDLKPTLILISMDGFRWDYLDRAANPNIHHLISTGVKAENLISSFPTKTFPNHYSIVTGLYPEHHGIVANKIHDPIIGSDFATNNLNVFGDGRWWGGEPLWVTAGKQGQISATLFWPGSEAEIGGKRPDFWRPFDDRLSYSQRINQLLEWLELPASQRPTFITLYIEELDRKGHSYGPDSAEVKASIEALDQLIGEFYQGLAARGIADKINLILTSDHGMAATSPERVIVIDNYLDSAKVGFIEETPLLWVYPKADQIEEVYQSLCQAHPHLHIYRKNETPLRYHYRDNPRIAPIIGIADEGWTIQRAKFDGQFSLGNHGYDPDLMSMRGIFIAHGPAFKSNLVLPPIHNTDIYNLMATVLNLKPAPNDGCSDCLKSSLR